MPPHRRVHNGPEEPLEQYSRRPERSSVLSDHTANVDNARRESDSGIDADIEVRMLLSWGESDLQRGVRNGRCMSSGDVVEVRKAIV